MTHSANEQPKNRDPRAGLLLGLCIGVALGVSLGVVGIVLYYGLHAALLWRASLRQNRGEVLGRFVLLFVPLMILLDLVTVSFYMKLPTLLLITCAGWVCRETRGGVRA